VGVARDHKCVWFRHLQSRQARPAGVLAACDPLRMMLLGTVNK
jgi:hypothetical protein